MRGLNLLLAALLIVALAIGCGGSSPDPAQEPPPKKAPPKAEKKVPPKPAAAAKSDAVEKAVKKSTSIDVTKSKEVLDKVGITYTYDPVNKPDPFKVYKTGELDDDYDTTEDLYKYEVRYFRLVGIIAADGEPLALFEDPNGRAYTLGVGARIGRGGGVIQSISKDLVIVTETRISPRFEQGTETVQIPIKLHPDKDR